MRRIFFFVVMISLASGCVVAPGGEGSVSVNCFVVCFTVVISIRSAAEVVDGSLRVAKVFRTATVAKDVVDLIFVDVITASVVVAVVEVDVNSVVVAVKVAGDFVVVVEVVRASAVVAFVADGGLVVVVEVVVASVVFVVIELLGRPGDCY